MSTVATGKLLGFEVPAKSKFEGADTLIVDDYCDAGGTFLGIAEQVKDYGLRLGMYTTHGLYSKGIEALGAVFDKIYCSDSLDPGYPEVKVINAGNLMVNGVAAHA